MEAKQFFKGLSWLLVLNLLVKPAWIFVIDRQVQNSVGHRVYGAYFALFNLTYVLLFVADAGLTNMLTQRLAAGEKLHLKQLFRLKLLLLLLYATVCSAVAYATQVSQWQMLGYLILIQSFTSLFVFLRGLLTAAQLFKAGAFFSVLDKSLLFLLCIGPVYGLFRPMTMMLFLQLQTLSTFVAVCALSLYALKKDLFAVGNKTSIRKIAAWVSPFVIIVLLMSAHNRLDAFLLERLHPDGAKQAGIYASAYRLLDAANVLGYLAASFLVPFVSRHRQEKALVQKVVILTRHSLLFCAVGATAFVIVLAPWLQQVLYHTSSAYSDAVFRLCLAVLPACYLTHIYGSVLTATANLKHFIQIMLLAVAANFFLNLWLIPSYGAAGCCTAALVTQYGAALLSWIVGSKRAFISLSAGGFLFYFFALLFFLSVFYFGQKLPASVWIILSSIVLFAFVWMLTQRSRVKKSFYRFTNKYA